jgi:lipopolysaccharide/colanic/teichoic acid biosynthesis glycosyltransferase
VLKRALDLVVAALGLLLLSPLFLVVATAVKLTSPGPVFYRWEVVGRLGRRFIGYKFRSMVNNADSLKESLLRSNLRNGPVFKMQNDPRVTAVGRLLRRFSIDELPQLWSVLKGDMTLVGPRPVGPLEWARFEPWHRRKLSVTPGAICLWHVAGQPPEFADWIRLDLDYIDHWSFTQDLTILARGVGYVVQGRNC